MSDWQDDWEEVALGDVAEIINGRAYKLSEWETSGTPVIRLQNLTQRRGDFYFSNLVLPEKQYCTKGDLLYMWSASFGPHIWWGEKAIFHYHIWKIEPNERIDKRFLFYLLDAKTQEWKTAGSGMAMIHLTKAGIEKELLSVPPLPEQKKIAEILSGIDRLVDAKKRRAKQRKLLLKSALEDATKKEASDNFVPLSDLGRWRGGGTPSKSIPGYWGGVIPWVSPKDMKGRKISCSQDAITQEALENSTASLIPKDSILFVVRSGILRHTFPIALATREVAINQDLKALTVSDHCNPNFLLHYLCCRSEEILASCMKSGTTVESIDTNSLQNYQVPVISIQEQLRLSLFAESITTAIEAEESQVASLKMLKLSLGSDLLSGRKRVSV